MTVRESERKVVLITGASSGIGRETALTLRGEGHVVIGAARRIEKMQDLVGNGGHAVQLDVTDDDAVEDAVGQILRDHGRIDVLVNNAGYAIYGAVEDTTLEDARRQFAVNVFGVAAVTKAVLPSMRERRSGRILNVTSMGGRIYTPLGAWYHATKHALEGWSDCLRIETAPFGIEVVVIEPGGIATEFGEVMLQPMLDRAAGGPYEDLTRAVAAAARTSYERGDSSPPSVIADLISRVIAARKPRPRYAAGRYAKPLMWARKWLGDRVFDRLLSMQVRRMQ